MKVRVLINIWKCGVVPDEVRHATIKYPVNIFFPNRGQAILEFDPNEIENVGEMIAVITNCSLPLEEYVEVLDVELEGKSDLFGKYFVDVCYNNCSGCEHLITTRNEDYFFDLISELLTEEINKMGTFEATRVVPPDSPDQICLKEIESG